MVKFGKKLDKHQVVEWRLKYCHYALLKRKLSPIISNSQADYKYKDSDYCLEHIKQQSELYLDTSFNFCRHIPPSVYNHEAEKLFFEELSCQYNKVLCFYVEKLKIFTHSINELADQIKMLNPDEAPKDLFKKNRRGLKYTAIELNRALKLLENFQQLNSTAFVKILKKHDKFSTWTTSKISILHELQNCALFQRHHLKNLFVKLEYIYIYAFSNGNRKRGKTQLRAQGKQSSKSVSFLCGIFYGLAAGLFALLIFNIVRNYNSNALTVFIDRIPIYRGYCLLALHISLWGVDKLILERAQINYQFVMQTPPKSQLTPERVLLLGSALLLFSLATANLVLLLFLNGKTDYADTFSVVFFIGGLFCIFNPLKGCCHNSRFIVLKAFLRLGKLPWISVSFMDFFVMDQVTSLLTVSYDINFGMCFLFNVAFLSDTRVQQCKTYNKHSIWVLCALPFIVRGLQCVRRSFELKQTNPHLINAGKYFSAVLFVMTMKLYETMRKKELYIVFIIIATASTIYSFLWDLVVDWGLFKITTAGISYQSKRTLPIASYWFAAITNLFLRITWVAYVSPGLLDLKVSQSQLGLAVIVSALESFRRCQWNLFRLENEHLNNVGQFRATDIITTDSNVPFTEKLK